MKSWTSHIKESFSKAENYDAYAVVQPIAADILAQTVLSRINPKNVHRILELGAGTGTLTLKIAPFFPKAEYLCTDLSKEMLKRAEKKTRHLKQNLSFLPLNMEELSQNLPDKQPLSGEFDLIISNLAFQWVKDRQSVLKTLHKNLSKNGSAFLTTLSQDSLKEWRDSCDASAYPCAIPQYPSCKMLEAEYETCKWKSYEIEEKVKNALSFLKGLKEIGATPKNLSLHQNNKQNLRNVIAFFNAHYHKVTYQIALGEMYK
ncbi:methyltransferase domain-containing protein [Acetobacteraceae bacterium]|nr:methyltransferase domain-containing protein [Acetobacteraceae bacterium]